MAQKRIARKKQNPIKRLYRETVGELRKVSWPTRREALNLTFIVVVVIAMMAVIFGTLDSTFSWIMSFVIGT